MNLRLPLGPFLAASLLATAAIAQAQAPVRSAPVAVPVVDTIPPSLDIPYPGTITLNVDATDVVRGIYRVTETIPVSAGQRELILMLPNWIPGKHAPRNFTQLLADLRFTVDGKPANWTRDPVETNAFRIPLPAAAREVTATFVHTSA